MQYRSYFIFFFAVCVSINLPAPAQPTKDKPLPISADVIKGKLSNGLTYYIRKNAEPKNRAELRLVINAGSILEEDKQVGLAHFTEHMAFNGTKNFEKQEIIDFLEKSGVTFGADLNAYTSFDETVYMLQLPTDSPQVFKKGFQILEDWAHNVTFENDEVDKERGVIIEEWRLGLGAASRMRDKYFPVIFKGSQYAKRIPIGTKQNLDTFHYETLKKFYQDWYRPDLQALIVVGDVNVEEVEKMIREHFGKIPKPAKAKPRIKYKIPTYKDTRISILTDPEQQYNLLQIFYLQPSIPEAKTNLQYRSIIVRELFNEMMNTRLQELSNKPDAPFLQGISNYGKFISNKDALTLIAIAKSGEDIGKSTQALLTENERVRQFGFTETELERAKKSLMSNIENLYNERDKTRSAALVQELIDNYLNEEPIPGIAYEYDLYQKFVQGIALKEVNNLIQQWVKTTDRSVVVLAPESEKEKLISQKDMLALLNRPVSNLVAYKDSVSAVPILAKEPVAGKIVEEKKYDSVGATMLVLSNGARVILKPTSFKNDEIQFSAISPGGTSLYPDSDYVSASNAAHLAFISGAGNLSYINLQKALSGKQVFVAPSLSMYSEGFTGTSTPKDIETALQLLYGYFTQPRKDTDMFKVAQQQITVQLTNKGKDPNNVFSDTIQYVMGSYHPRRKPLTLERLNELNLDKAFAVYTDRYATANDFLFTFVGSFKTDSLKPLIEKYIASLPNTGRKENWKDIGLRYPQGVIEKTVKKGQENKSAVRLYFSGMTAYSDLEDIQLDQMCEALQIKLREVLREDKGGVYGVNVSGGINREPVNSYNIMIGFGCAPENVDTLIASVMDEIHAMKQNGASQVNVNKVMAEDTRNFETQIRENGYWRYNLEQSFYYNQEPNLFLHDLDMVKQLTAERTKELANKYFNEENMAKFVLMPEK